MIPHDAQACLTANAVERALRGVTPGRKVWLFMVSERGGQRAAMMYTLITQQTGDDVDPQVRLAGVLARIANTAASPLQDLRPWNRFAARENALADQSRGVVVVRHHLRSEPPRVCRRRFRLVSTPPCLRSPARRSRLLRLLPAGRFRSARAGGGG
ncbi:IS66 family transposase [Palleronia rufa]|uniref:IS66 family transposase n=1 Tax=Palleronia rufa TaxID=1530186 RepID=UPI0012691FC1